MSVVVEFRLVGGQDSFPFHVDGAGEPGIEGLADRLGAIRNGIRYRGKVFSREELLSAVWPDDVIVTARTVDVNITRIRKKIGPYADCIVTRPGFGYSFLE